MSRTVNRLTDRNGLYAVDRETGSTIPVSGNTLSVFGGIVTSSVAFFTVDTNFQFQEDDIIFISGAGNVNASCSFIDGYRYVSSVSSSLSYPYISIDSSLISSTLGSASVTNQFSQLRIVPHYSYSWTTQNATSTVVSTNLSTQSRYAFKVSPSSSEPVVLSLNANSLYIGDNNKEFSFNCLINPSSTVNVNAKITVDGEVDSGTPVQTTIYSGAYNAARSNTVLIPDDEEEHSVSIQVTVSNHSGQTFYLTSPNLIDDELYYTNNFVISSRQYMPDFYWDADYSQENPKAPFHKFIDAISTVAGYSHEEYNNILSYEKSEVDALNEEYENVYHSNLVEPYYVKDEYAPWLAQFTGSKLKRNIIGEAEERLLPSYDTENAYARWQLNTGYFGIGAGTRKAMIEAVQEALLFSDRVDSASPSFYFADGLGASLTFSSQHPFRVGQFVHVDNVASGIDSISYLSTDLYEVTDTTPTSISFVSSASSASVALSASAGPLVSASIDSTYSVAITPRFNNDTFSIRIQTLVSETPDVTASGQISQMILNAVEAARPLGYKVYHIAAGQFLFTLDDLTLGVIGEIAIG